LLIKNKGEVTFFAPLQLYTVEGSLKPKTYDIIVFEDADGLDITVLRALK
jgi:hypothetical protein